MSFDPVELSDAQLGAARSESHCSDLPFRHLGQLAPESILVEKSVWSLVLSIKTHGNTLSLANLHFWWRSSDYGERGTLGFNT